LNDAGIIAGIWGALLIIGFLLPYVNTTFNTNIPIYDANAGTSNIINQQPNAVNGWSVLASMLLVNFSTFGGIPWYLDLTLLMIMRVVLAFVIARNIWIGGGA